MGRDKRKGSGRDGSRFVALPHIGGIAKAMAGFNATALVVPAIIGAIVLAVGALIDDWMVWKEGGDSVLGGLIEQFPMLEGAILGIEDAIRSVGEFLFGIFETLGPSIGDLAAALWNLATTILSAVWPVVKMVFEGWAYILAGVIPILAQIVAAITNGIVGAINGIITTVTTVVDRVRSIVQGFVDFVSGAIARVAGVFGGGAKLSVSHEVKDAVSVAPAAKAMTGAATEPGTLRVEGAGSTPAAKPGGVLGKAADQAAGASASSTSYSNVQVSAPITINSPDPAKAGESVRKELNRVNRQATRNGEGSVAL